MGLRAQASLIRQWQLVEALAPHRRGLTMQQLLERSEASRSTTYRDLAILRDAGVPIESHTVTGEVRYTLFGRGLPDHSRRSGRGA